MLGWLAVLLLLQIPNLVQVGRILFENGYAPPASHSGPYYRQLGQAFATQGFWDVCKINVWPGPLARWWWTFESGRYLQMMGLFVWGLLLGRSRVFENPEAYVRLAQRALGFGLLGFALLYPLRRGLPSLGLSGQSFRVCDGLLGFYGNLTQMAVWVGGFVLLYHSTSARNALRWLIPYGRMSLTCYITQALVGVPVFYHYGLELFRQLGEFYSILYGMAFFVVQCAAAHWWIKRFPYGPVEWLWRCATLLTFKVPLRRRAIEPSAGSETPGLPSPEIARV